MTTDHLVIQLFTLKSAIINRELNNVLRGLRFGDQRTDLERTTDTLVEAYLRQIDNNIISDGARMAEFYRVFYAVENDIRQLISLTLCEALGNDWWEKAAPQAVRENVTKLKQREESEGVPPRSFSNIDYTTFGELGEIIRENWDVFSGIFSNATKSRVLRVVNRLNVARGPIAHCGNLPPEETVRLKLTVRDWYSLME